MLALIVPMLVFTGCGGDDEPDKPIPLQFENEELEVVFKSIGYVYTNKDCAYTSENADIATVDASGKVSGVGVGETYIVARAGSETARCKVVVSYQWGVFDEPILDFGKTADEIKQIEKHELVVDNVQYVTVTDIGRALYYNAKTYNGIEYQYHYNFIDREGKTMFEIRVNYPEELSAEILLMMNERYAGGSSAGGSGFKWTDVDKGISIRMYNKQLIYKPI